jgi:hypothetical protein
MSALAFYSLECRPRGKTIRPWSLWSGEYHTGSCFYDYITRNVTWTKLIGCWTGDRSYLQQETSLVVEMIRWTSSKFLKFLAQVWFRKTFTIALRSHQFRCHFTSRRNIISYKWPENLARIGHFVREIWSWKRLAYKCVSSGVRYSITGKTGSQNRGESLHAILAHAFTPPSASYVSRENFSQDMLKKGAILWIFTGWIPEKVKKRGLRCISAPRGVRAPIPEIASHCAF